LIQALNRYRAYGRTGAIVVHAASPPSVDAILTLRDPVCAMVSTPNCADR
jgi:hypothetical protein